MRNEGTSHYKVVKKSVISLVGGKLSEMRVDNCGFIYMQSTKLDTIWKMQLHLHVFNVIIWYTPILKGRVEGDTVVL